MLLPLVVLTLALAACSPPTAEKLLADAKESLAKGSVSTAVTQLKSSLATAPNVAETRLLLGQILLESGDEPAALVELRKAQELQVDPERVAPLIARALLATRQFQQLSDEFGDTELKSPQAAADLFGHVAEAHLSLGRQAKAAESIRLGMATDPTRLPVISAGARLLVAEGKPAEALALLDKGLQADGKNVRLLNQRANVQFQQLGDVAGAIATLERVVAAEPRDVEARSNLFVLQMGKGNQAAAKAQLEFFTRHMPKDPQTLFFTAVLAHAEKDHKRAMETVQTVLKLIPDNPQALLFAGVIHLESDSLLNAERFLSKALAINPRLTLARQHLAEAHLKLGDPQKALSTLDPLIGAGGGGARTHVLAGEAHVKAGNVDRSIASFLNAQRLDPGNPTLATQLALARARTEPLEKTVEALRKISAGDKSTTADLALVSLLMRNKEHAKALAAVDVLDAKLPRSPVPEHLRGFLQVQQRQLGDARKSFERSLQRLPSYFPATTSLAAIDLAEKRPQDAQARYRALLKADTKHVGATLELAKLLIDDPAGKDEAIKLVKGVIALDGSRPEAHLLLIRHLLATKDYRASLDAAQAARAALPENPEILDVVGRTQIAAGDLQQAISTFSKLVALDSSSANAHVRLAGAHLAANNKAAAEQSLKKALAVAPDFVPAQQALISLAQADGRHDEAIKIGRGVIKQRPKDPVGYLLTGTIESNRNNHAAAAAVYREGLAASPDTRLAAKLHATLAGAGSGAEADAFARSWQAQHPKDLQFIAFLGDSALARQQFAAAEGHFRAIVAADAKNVAALNNLAWALSKQGKPGAAALARKAVELRPDTPGLLDTLAAALASEGDLPQAIEVQKKALALAPGDEGLRFHLAQHYVKAGKTADARRELETLGKLGDKLPVHAEVKRMLAALK